MDEIDSQNFSSDSKEKNEKFSPFESFTTRGKAKGKEGHLDERKASVTQKSTRRKHLRKIKNRNFSSKYKLGSSGKAKLNRNFPNRDIKPFGAKSLLVHKKSSNRGAKEKGYSKGGSFQNIKQGILKRSGLKSQVGISFLAKKKFHRQGRSEKGTSKGARWGNSRTTLLRWLRRPS